MSHGTVLCPHPHSTSSPAVRKPCFCCYGFFMRHSSYRLQEAPRFKPGRLTEATSFNMRLAYLAPILSCLSHIGVVAAVAGVSTFNDVCLLSIARLNTEGAPSFPPSPMLLVLVRHFFLANAMCLTMMVCRFFTDELPRGECVCGSIERSLTVMDWSTM